MAHAKVSEETKESAKAELLKVLHDGDEVYTILRSVSRSGMSRRIDLFTFRWNEMRHETYKHPIETVKPLYLSYMAELVLAGKKLDRNKQGIRIDGCGMDMGFHLVEQLGQALGIKLIQRWL